MGSPPPLGVRSFSLRSKFTSGIGPDGGSSGSMALRHQTPVKSGAGFVSAPMTGQKKIEAEANPIAARPKHLLEMARIVRSPLHEHAHTTASPEPLDQNFAAAHFPP